MTRPRQQWGSRIGFILAASGSAIGLGNIVFFSANAYTWGAGAFYVPYLVALITAGIPVMLLEFGLGRFEGASFPASLSKIAGRTGEFAGWWAIVNALLITMYYCAILGWVAGMWWSSVAGSLWTASVEVPAFDMAAGDLPNPYASFFSLISSWSNVLFVAGVWAVNLLLVLWGTRSIERGVKWMMPTLWVFMLGLLALGSTLDGAIHGAYLLLSPDFSVLSNPKVWHGAFSQIFFTLSLGFGVMSAYSSYLPRKSDHTANTLTVAGLNCTFELIAGLAVFSLLFAFSVTPKASTLSMMFFIVPQGIAQLGVATQLVGSVFFTLLLLAGLTSSVSLTEAAVSAVIDKFDWPRKAVAVAVVSLGMVGSVFFALPTVVDSGLNSNGTLGLTLLDLIDHYAFSYGLLIVGLLECIIIGWFLPVERLIDSINEDSTFRLGRGFAVMVRWVLPAILLALLGYSVALEVQSGALYGATMTIEQAALAWLPFGGLIVWLGATVAGAAALAWLPTRSNEEA